MLSNKKIDLTKLEISLAAILDFFQRGLGQNFKFLLSMCIVKLNLEMMFDNFFSNKKVNSTIEEHWEISPVAIMDFSRGVWVKISNSF